MNARALVLPVLRAAAALTSRGAGLFYDAVSTRPAVQRPDGTIRQLAFTTDITGGSGAPTTADYLVKTADGTLSAERVVTDNTQISAVWTTPGQVTFALVDGGVTLAKMADIATDRLLGRDTPGTGVLEALTVGGGLEFTGSGGIQRGAITGDVTVPAGSNTATVTAAGGLKSATTTVTVSTATAPTAGQVLTATSSTEATWQTPGGVMTTGSTWDRPAPESVDAGTRFFDVDSLVSYTSSGQASPGWAVELGLSYGRDQAGLAMNGNLCNLGSENVSAYTRGAATMAMLFYWNGGGSGYNGIFCVGTLTTGTLVVLQYSGANLLLQTYQSGTLTTLQTFAPASALSVGLHALCIAPVSSGGDKWRWSFDGSAVADTAMAAAWVTPSSTGNVTFGSSISDSPMAGRPIDLAVWGSTLSNANILALATLPGTPTYRLPIVSGMGVPSIRVEANRYNPLTPTQLYAKGLSRPMVLGSAITKWSP